MFLSNFTYCVDKALHHSIEEFTTQKTLQHIFGVLYQAENFLVSLTGYVIDGEVGEKTLYQPDYKSPTCFLFNFTEDAEERRLHPVTVQSMFPTKTHQRI